MYDKIFIPYWKFTTFFYKPIKPYYNWMWRQPGKKAIFLVVITGFSLVFQYKMLEKWSNKVEETEKKNLKTSSAHS